MDKPKFLYCYFEIGRGLDFLKTLKLRLSSIEDFNDPFELLFKTIYPQLFISSSEGLSEDDVMNRISELKKHDTFACSYRLKNKILGRINLLKNLRVFCLSEAGDSTLMWSHYGRKYTGIVIKFRISLQDWGNDLIKVDYNDTVIDINDFDDKVFGLQPLERNLIYRKSTVWAYEREWRYVKPTKECLKDELGYYKNMDKSSILEIIVGCRIGSNDLKEVKDIVATFNNIPINVALPDGYVYKTKIKNLTEVEYLLLYNRNTNKLSNLIDNKHSK